MRMEKDACSWCNIGFGEEISRSTSVVGIVVPVRYTQLINWLLSQCEQCVGKFSLMHDIMSVEKFDVDSLDSELNLRVPSAPCAPRCHKVLM